jgi:hypothetical protein
MASTGISTTAGFAGVGRGARVGAGSGATAMEGGGAVLN